MKIKGQGYLLECSTYKSKNQDGSYTPKFKYVFLVGDQENDTALLFNARVEQCISDVALLKNITFMRKIDVEITLRSFFRKIGDQFVETTQPIYVVCKE